MAKKGSSQIRLGQVELQIMNVVWEKGTATVHNVKDALSRGRKPAYSTILTMMRKLEVKGYLKHDVDERTYVYRPAISKKAVRHGILGDVLDRLFEGSPSVLLNSLVEHYEVWLQEYARLRGGARQDTSVPVYTGPKGYPFPTESEERFRAYLADSRSADSPG